MIKSFSSLVPSLLSLAACDARPGPASSNACTPQELQSRQARTPACAAQFQAMLDAARAQAERDAAVSRAPPRAARDSL